MNTLIITLSSISYTFVAIILGYKISMLFWQPKELLKTGQDLLQKNQEITKQTETIIAQSKEIETISLQKDTWYMQQLQLLAQYLKDKHNDNYIYEQLKHVQGFTQPIIETKKDKEEKTYDVDSLLDKINKSGIVSLTEDEVKFLKSQENDSNRNL